MKKLFIISCLSFVYLISCSNPDKLFEYKINDNEVKIIKYIGKSLKVNVPKTINDFPVTVIGKGAFKGSNLLSKLNMAKDMGLQDTGFVYIPDPEKEFRNNRIKSIVLPETIITIEESAFENTYSLTSFIIPSSVITIEQQAFKNSGLINIVIPNSVEYIGGGAFSNTNLTKIVIPDTLKYIGGGTFENCNLTIVEILAPIEDIKSYTFKSNQISNIIIPNTVKVIQTEAFSNNNIENIIIPNSVTYIGDRAFGNNNIKSIDIPDNVYFADDVFDIYTERGRTETGLLSVVANTNITRTVNNNYTDKGMKKINLFFITSGNYDIVRMDNSYIEIQLYNGNDKNIIIPSHFLNTLPVHFIGEGAFRNKQIESVNIPNTVKEIGRSAFRTNQISKITIPSNVQSIGFAAFAENPLTNITKHANTTVHETSFLIGDNELDKAQLSLIDSRFVPRRGGSTGEVDTSLFPW